VRETLLGPNSVAGRLSAPGLFLGLFEAGRGAAGNADYRDIVRTSLILDAQYMALLIPQRYRTTSGGKEHTIPAYEKTNGQLDAVVPAVLPGMGASLDPRQCVGHLSLRGG